MDSKYLLIADTIAVQGQRVLMQKLFDDNLLVQKPNVPYKLNVNVSQEVDYDIDSCAILDSDICICSNRIISSYSTGKDKFKFSLSGLEDGEITIAISPLVDYSCFLNKLFIPFVDYLLNMENKFLLQGKLVNNTFTFSENIQKNKGIKELLIVSDRNIYELAFYNKDSAVCPFNALKLHWPASNVAESLFWSTEHYHLYFRGLLYSYMFLFPDKQASKFKENYIKAVNANL